ncbi:hypothetical protein F5Y15DRAFT_428757 [Xylariaceae sp. FL0016]|nr:hypothetical protein F5Y15DRAFT_428757 [Xylariaceae sp. FL0016]
MAIDTEDSHRHHHHHHHHHQQHQHQPLPYHHQHAHQHQHQLQQQQQQPHPQQQIEPRIPLVALLNAQVNTSLQWQQQQQQQQHTQPDFLSKDHAKASFLPPSPPIQSPQPPPPPPSSRPKTPNTTSRIYAPDSPLPLPRPFVFAPAGPPLTDGDRRMDALPQDVLDRILRHVPYETALFLPAVSRRWRERANPLLAPLETCIAFVLRAERDFATHTPDKATTKRQQQQQQQRSNELRQGQGQGTGQLGQHQRYTGWGLGCYTCFRVRPAPYFAVDQPLQALQEDPASGTRAYVFLRRFCIECGVRTGLHKPGDLMETRHLGNVTGSGGAGEGGGGGTGGGGGAGGGGEGRLAGEWWICACGELWSKARYSKCAVCRVNCPFRGSAPAAVAAMVGT